jgi:hypothetical protein
MFISCKEACDLSKLLSNVVGITRYEFEGSLLPN